MSTDKKINTLILRDGMLCKVHYLLNQSLSFTSHDATIKALTNNELQEKCKCEDLGLSCALIFINRQYKGCGKRLNCQKGNRKDKKSVIAMRIRKYS